MKFRNFFVKLVLVLAGLALTLAILEGGANLYYKWRGTRLTESSTEFAGYRLYRYLPKANIPVPIEGAADLKTDSYSFVMNGDAERIYEAEHPGITRVLIFGGSTVEGHGATGGDKTIAAVLEKKLKEARPEKQFEVLNLGVAGYLSSQEFLYFKEVAAKLRPEIVVVLDGVNDMHYNYFRETNLFSDFEERPDFSWRLAELEDSLNRDTPVIFKTEYLSKHSYFFRGLLSWLAQRQAQGGYKIALKQNESCGLTPEKLIVASKETSAEYVRNLSLMNFLAVSQGAEFFAFLQPVITYKQNLSPAEKEFSEFSESYFRRGSRLCLLGDPTMYRECEQNFFREAAVAGKKLLGGGFTDLSSLFKSNSEGIFVDRVHYNDAGDELIAESIARKILPRL